MAIYYMNVQIIGRSAGRTATGAAAYRAGERIVDDRTGQVFDYTRRRGGDRGADPRTGGGARLGAGQGATVEPGRRGHPPEPGQPHAHIMLTMREMGPEGFSAKKNREWNQPELLVRWREQWAEQSNRSLERAGREERIDNRSLAEQGVERLPQVHLGPHASALERQGIPTERGEHNRQVVEHNAVVVDLEKAREEKRQLQVEKAVTERYNTRLKAGSLPAHAQALGKLEYRLGGGELTYRETARLSDSYRREQPGLNSSREPSGRRGSGWTVRPRCWGGMLKQLHKWSG